VLEGPFALAVAAGMAATVNPCGFALLPAYLAAFVGEDHEPGAGAVPRAFAVSGALTAGFVVVFGLFGAVISPLAVSVEQYLPWATIVIGVGVVALGGWLLAGRELVLHIPKLNRGGSDGSLASMFLFGVSYASRQGGVRGAQTAPMVPGPECAPMEGPTSYRVSSTMPSERASAAASRSPRSGRSASPTPTRSD